MKNFVKKLLELKNNENAKTMDVDNADTVGRLKW